MADFSQPTNAADEGQRNAVVLKVGMVGDARVGKTTLMVKYVENKLDEDYIQTLGVNFLEKTVTLCVEIKILRRVRAESPRRPPRHRRDACSMAWRCRFLAARPSQDGSVIAEK